MDFHKSASLAIIVFTLLGVGIVIAMSSRTQQEETSNETLQPVVTNDPYDIHYIQKVEPSHNIENGYTFVYHLWQLKNYGDHQEQDIEYRIPNIPTEDACKSVEQNISEKYKPIPFMSGGGLYLYGNCIQQVSK